MTNCRMCETKMLGDTAPLDGLCGMCHISLCQKGLGKCVRCAKITDNLVNFLYPEKDPDGEEKKET